MGAYFHLKEFRCLVAQTYRLTLAFILLLFLYNQVSAATISGTLYHSDGVMPIINEWVLVELTQDDLYINSVSVSSEDGTYSFEDVGPGFYSVRISPNPFCGPFVVEWYASPESVRNESSSQLVSAPSEGIDFQLDRGATFSGTIYHADGETIITEGPVMIEIVEGDPCSDDSRVAGWTSQDYSTGNYTIDAIGTGTYYIQTGTHLDYDIHKKEWWNYPLSELSCSLAQAITVNDGEVITGKDFQMNLKSSNDNSGTTVFYRDSDGDGYGDPDMPYDSISQPSGFVLDNTDCVDYEPSIHPEATEICGDGIDQDCNGSDCPTLLTKTQISQLYVSIFGRACEGEGNTYWQSNQSDMTVAADTMLNTEPAKAYFGNTLYNNQAFIEFIYENTLGKTYAEDPEGVSYWVNELSGSKSKGDVVATLINAAIDPQYAGLASQDQFLNKVTVCNYTADTISTVPDVDDLSVFVNFISSVTDNPATVTSAKAAVDAF